MTILVTGANGLVGKALWREFNKLNISDVVHTDLVSNRELGVKHLDITDFNKVNNCIKTLSNVGLDTVYHLAALCGGKESEKRPYDYIHVNVDGTLNILEAMRLNNVERLIFMSSWSTYGNHDGLITDETKQRPLNPYGTSKIMCEREIETYCDLYGLTAVILRPTMIYGPEQTEMNHVQQILNSMENGYKFEIWGTGEHTRELLYSDDMAKILSTCYWFKPHKKTETFVIGTENPLSVKDVAEAGHNISNGFDIKYVPSTKWVFSQRSSCENMKNILGIDPTTFTDIETGLWKCLEYRISQESKNI